VLASTVLGAGCGTLDAGINAHVATTGDLRSLNLLHAAYGLGATLAPLLLTLVLHVGGSWRIAYGLLAAYCVVLVVGYACTRHRWVTPARDESDESDGEPLQRPRLEAVRGLAGVTLLAFFVYVGVEATAGRWAYTLFTEGRGMPDGAAGLWAGGFWLALTASRFLTVFSRLGAERLIDLGIAGMLIGSALLWWAPTSGVAGVGLLVVGLGAAPIFPAFVHLTPDRFGAQGASHAIGYQVAMAGAAAAIVPGVVGVLAGHVGLGVIAPSMVIGSLVLVVLHRLLAAAVARTPVRSAG
jgi:fucose permease